MATRTPNLCILSLAVKYFENSSETITGVFTGSFESSPENDDLPPLGEYFRENIYYHDSPGSYYVMTENSQVLQAYWSEDGSGFSEEKDDITKALKSGRPLRFLCIRNKPVGGYPEIIQEYRSRAGVIKDAVIDFAIYYFPLITLLAIYFVITLIITIISKITEKREKMLVTECRNELENHIIPFWNALRDDEFGGFYGQMDNDLKVDKKGGKGVILNSRILWFYSQCYITIGGEQNLSNARHAYEFLKRHCVDWENGGVYWMMNHDGTVCDSMKHTYNQAFAVYALSTYYLACKDEEALRLAFTLFDTVEEKCTDDVAYMEAFDKNWQLIENDALSENGLMADKTMNTVLHLIEAYTVLYKASGDERVKNRLKFLLDITDSRIFDSDSNKLFVFFDRELNVIGDIHSYGHDIEASWLLDRACDELGDREYIEKWKNIDLRIAENILNIAYENGALNNERDKTEIDKKRIWWVQAETVVGFVNAYMHEGDKKFLDAAVSVWEWIKNHQIDSRPGSEWWAEVGTDGKPLPEVTMVNEWKCPYHNGRMCLEIINRGIDT